jgi:pilus assembly protein Flp/PilA
MYGQETHSRQSASQERKAMQRMTEQYVKFVNAVESREEGQGLVEYALIIALVAILLVVALTGLKDGITTTFNTITANLSG